MQAADPPAARVKDSARARAFIERKTRRRIELAQSPGKAGPHCNNVSRPNGYFRTGVSPLTRSPSTKCSTWNPAGSVQ